MAPSLSRASPLRFKIRHDAPQPVVIETFAQRVVERHAEPLVHDLDFGQARRQNLAPQLDIGRIAAMQPGRFQQHLLADIGMCGCQLA